MMKILLIDCDPLALKSFEIMLSKEPKMMVLGAVPNCVEALDICAETEPDVMLIDIRSDSVNGVNLVKKHYPHIRIVMLINMDTHLEIDKVVALGVGDYISKSWRISAIMEKMRGLMEH